MARNLSSNTEIAETTAPEVLKTDLDSGSPAVRFDNWLAQKLLAGIGNPPITLILRDGSRIQTNHVQPDAGLHITDRAALLLLLVNPEYYFGELYAAGRIEVDGGLVNFLNTIYRSLYPDDRPAVSSIKSGLMRGFFSGNGTAAARRNIHHHYDIGNAFYEKWLDREMQYTCAYFPDPDFTLEQAQFAKMHHVCRKLLLRPGQTVVEAGCGWGGLARFMAREYGVSVRAYNISREQVAWARERARAEGVADRVIYIEDDFRNIQGEFDRFVSVGMLEHVGLENYPVLGRVIDACLKETGVGLIHSIGFNRPDYLNPWIEKRIFPGACPPSLSQMMDIFEPFNFSVLDIENLRLHYARTLEHWQSRFEANLAWIRSAYDEEFIRAWRLYLSGSISAFQTGSMQLFQAVFTRAGNNQLPWSRSYLYPDK